MPFEQQLDNGLLFRTVRNEEDIVKYVAFNTQYNNPSEGANTNLLLRYLPGTQYENFQLIEDPLTGQIAATTCLIPWEMQFEGITLRTAQLEQVLSHPQYRRHGLIKILIRRFMQDVAERQCDLSFIWGIPYYYRQYGYAYAVYGNSYESLPAWRIPDAGSGEALAYQLRKATLADSATLTRLYMSAMRHLALSVDRNEVYWHYLLEHAGLPVEVVEDTVTGNAVGYIARIANPDGSGLNIIEHALEDQAAAFAVLRMLKAQTGEEIQVAWPRQSMLAQLAQSLGSLPMVTGQWLFHITHPARFLTKIAPVLERRLALAGCARITAELVINLFRQAYQLSFVGGKLIEVKELGFVDSSMGADGGDLCIPPDAFVRLVLGFRTVDELMDAWPDIAIKSRSRYIIDMLFPRRESYLHATYAYFGTGGA